MRRLLIAALALMAVASPALAQNVTTYVASDGSRVAVTDAAPLPAASKVQCDDVTIGTVTENSFGSMRMSCTNRALIVRPYETQANSWRYAAAASGIANSTTAVTIAAANATLRNCLIGLQISSGTLGAGTEIAARDGAGGTVLWRGYMSTAGGNQAISLGVPVCGTANTLLEVVTLTATITGAIYLNAQGVLIP